jgi:hypothetical protein
MRLWVITKLNFIQIQTTIYWCWNIALDFECVWSYNSYIVKQKDHNDFAYTCYWRYSYLSKRPSLVCL